LPRFELHLAIVVAAALHAGCRRASPASGPPPPIAGVGVAAEALDYDASVGRMERALPVVAGPFRGGPVERHDGFVRRGYVRGDSRIEITIAYRPQRGDDYQEWVTAARDYPLATLDLPPSEALGFFTCGDSAGRSSCDLHVQLRAGYHVEVMSSGTATRADLERLMVAVPMSVLVAVP
jgi:hypothetical protein